MDLPGNSAEGTYGACKQIWYHTRQVLWGIRGFDKGSPYLALVSGARHGLCLESKQSGPFFITLEKEAVRGNRTHVSHAQMRPNDYVIRF